MELITDLFFLSPLILFACTLFYTQEYRFMLQCFLVALFCANFPFFFMGMFLGLPSILLYCSVMGIIKYKNLIK